jgi:DNA-binding HxlR family transcriptional regulator
MQVTPRAVPPPKKTRTEAPKAFRRSACAVANTLDLVGDKWSLLVVRDLLHGKQTFSELLDSPEAISTNLLADRLARLEEAGIIVSTPYQERPVRYAYSLSEKGMALGNVLQALVQWGTSHIPGTQVLRKASPAKTRVPSGHR